MYTCITCKYTAHAHTQSIFICGIQVNNKAEKKDYKILELKDALKIRIYMTEIYVHIKLLSNPLLTTDKVVGLSGVFSPYLIKIMVGISRMNVIK